MDNYNMSENTKPESPRVTEIMKSKNNCTPSAHLDGCMFGDEITEEEFKS